MHRKALRELIPEALFGLVLFVLSLPMYKLIVPILILALTACKKDPSQTAGTNSYVYESTEFVDIQTNFSVVVNTAQLFVNSAAPYQHILGQVIADANETKINGNEVEISDIEIDDIRVSGIELYSPYDSDSIAANLQSASLILAYRTSSGSEVEKILGTYSGLNSGENKLNFSLSGDQLDEFISNRPEILKFKFNFQRRPLSTMKVQYRVAFDYAYSYGTREDKD